MELKVGSQAPNVQTKNQNGEDVDFSLLRGRKIILYFYPKDNTPGCTSQACNLRDNYDKLMNDGYLLFGISPDSEKSHKKFIEKFQLPFDLLIDEDHKIAESYGVWVEKQMYGKQYMGIARTTFIIDSNGMIEEIIQKVDTKNHFEQIIR